MPTSRVKELAPLTRDVVTELTRGIWEFRAGERVLSSALRFRPDGTLTGYQNPNESSWREENGALLLVSTRGRVTSRLSYTVTAESVIFEGKSLVNGSITFTLTRVDWDDRGRLPQLTRTLQAENIARFGWDIGDHTYGSPMVFERNAHLEIGKFCSMASGVQIALGNHRIDSVSTYPFATLNTWWPSATGLPDHDSRGAVTIGSDVWIGGGAFIASGVTIGHGAVIGAHAVVTKDVPPYAIVGGNPAKVIRYRFPPDAVERLLEVAWWNWPDELIDEHLPLMMLPDIEDFLTAAKSIQI